MTDSDSQSPDQPIRINSFLKRSALPHEFSGFDTRAVHAGLPANSELFAAAPANRKLAVSILEKKLADLEGGDVCVLAAHETQMPLSAILARVSRNDNIVVAANKQTEALPHPIVSFAERWGFKINLVENPCNPRAWHEAISADTRLVWIETPAYPCPFVIDIEVVADIAHSKGAVVLVDNSFVTAALQTPIGLGADLVLLQLRGFLSGQDALPGYALIGAETWIAPVRESLQTDTKSKPGPTEIWTTAQALSTLSLRMQKHSSNAQTVAEFLQGHPAVAQVIYPGLADHPQHELASYQMKGNGGVLSLLVKKGVTGARTFCNNLKLVKQTAAFGTSCSSCFMPKLAGRQSPAAKRQGRSGREDWIVISLGLENAEDIIADLNQALERLD